jgi:hypothetical protein
MDSPLCGKTQEVRWFKSIEGRVIRIPYFLSVAKTNWDNTDITWRIITRGHMSNTADLNECRNNPNEDELLYKRNSFFRVNGVHNGVVVLKEVESVESSYIDLVGNYVGCR